MGGRHGPTRPRSRSVTSVPAPEPPSRARALIAAVRLLLAGTRAVHTTASVSAHDLPKIGRTVSRMYRSLFLM